MLSKLAAFAAVAVSAVLAQPAEPLAIATVESQFVNALLVPSVVPTFKPVALLNVSFAGIGPISTGQALQQTQVATKPNITVIGTDADFASGGPFNSSAKYTIMMIDGDVPGATNPKGVNTHYLQNDLSFGAVSNDVLTFTNTTPPVIAYAGPGPASGSGPHRYTLLVYPQPSDFQAPATPTPGSSVTMIMFPTYLQEAGLTYPLAGNYFTVEVGTATVTWSTTQPANPAAYLPTGTTTSGAAGATGSSTSHSSNGAMAKGVNGFVVALGALMAGLLFA